MRSRNLFCSVLAMLFLSACSHSNNTADLEAYIAQLSARPAGKIDALPPLTAYQPVTFTGSDARSPFSLQPASTANDVRPKEPLEHFPIESLEFVGTIEQDNVRWGLIKATDSEIYKIEVGNYVGPNGGQVQEITANEVIIVEPVRMGSTSVKRQVIMQLKQQ